MGKKQHYVPKCYLKNFTKNEKLDVFCKTSNSIRSGCHISTIAAQNYFYNIEIGEYFEKLNLGLKENSFSNQVMEDIFSMTVEPRFSELLKIIITRQNIINPLKPSESYSFINDEEKVELSYLFSLQAIRTDKFRDKYIESIKSEIIKINSRRYGVDETLIRGKFGDAINFSKQDKALFHVTCLLQSMHSGHSAEILFKSSWQLCFNLTAINYWTSDNPIIPIQANINDNECRGWFIPINRKLGIRIIQNYDAGIDKKTTIHTSGEVLLLNFLQLINCKSEVYVT